MRAPFAHTAAGADAAANQVPPDPGPTVSTTLSPAEMGELFSFAGDIDSYWRDVMGYELTFEPVVTVPMAPEELEGFLAYREHPVLYEFRAPYGLPYRVKRELREHPVTKWVIAILACIPPFFILLPFVLYFGMSLLQFVFDGCDPRDLKLALEAALPFRGEG